VGFLNAGSASPLPNDTLHPEGWLRGPGLWAPEQKPLLHSAGTGRCLLLRQDNCKQLSHLWRWT